LSLRSFDAQLPRRPQCTGEHIFAGLGEADMSRSHSSPSAGNGKEDFGQLADEFFLHRRREHQVAIALLFGGECGEDPASDTKVSGAHVRTFLCAFEAERDTAEIGCIHIGK